MIHCNLAYNRKVCFKYIFCQKSNPGSLLINEFFFVHFKNKYDVKIQVNLRLSNILNSINKFMHLFVMTESIYLNVNIV